MKKWKRTLLSLSVAATMLFGTVAASHAALAPMRIGDADSDNYVTVTDATRIQRWLVGLAQMTKLEQYLGDVDGDGSCNIMDASRIQRKLV
ncbi:MAG: dockerin type I repeat-containing protein, partial [Ruminococcus sp.]|nr:dockerin type I repeat-containing protein [Ruminococcus sp.]